MRKLFYGILTLMILVGSAYAVAAGPAPGGPHGPGGPGGPGAHRLLDNLLALDLSPAQKHDVAVILQKSRTGIEDGGKDMREAMRGLHEIMRTDPGNEQRIREASHKVATIGENMAVARGKLEAEVLAVLTPEQRKLWNERMTPPAPPHKEPFHAGPELVNDWIDAHAGAKNQ